MASQQIDLLSLFGQATKEIKKNRTSLNQADTYNHDHGDHMVEIFDVVTQAMKAKKNAEPADQLEYAAQLLRRKTSSGSSTVYANGLEQAAKQVLGKELNLTTIMSIIAALMGTKPSRTSQSSGGGDLLGSLIGGMLGGGSAGSSSSQSAGGDLLGSLVGGLLGGSSSGSSSSQSAGGDLLGSLIGGMLGGSGSGSSSSQSAGGDLLGSLVGGLLGGSGASRTSGAASQGPDLSDLLGTITAQQGGKSGLEALTGALLNDSSMAQTPYRAQSGQVVTQALLKSLSQMMK